MIVNQERPKKATAATHGNKPLFLDNADQSAFFDRHFTNSDDVRFSVIENKSHLDSTVFKKYKKRRYHSDLFCRLHYSRGSLEWYPFECYFKR